jgi:hypothetical protein
VSNESVFQRGVLWKIELNVPGEARDLAPLDFFWSRTETIVLAGRFKMSRDYYFIHLEL